jgi:hypothetical protein
MSTLREQLAGWMGLKRPARWCPGREDDFGGEI